MGQTEAEHWAQAQAQERRLRMRLLLLVWEAATPWSQVPAAVPPGH